jgi:hypothetical protein
MCQHVGRSVLRRTYSRCNGSGHACKVVRVRAAVNLGYFISALCSLVVAGTLTGIQDVGLTDCIESVCTIVRWH